MLKGTSMNREEIINKLTQFWTDQLGKPSDFGSPKSEEFRNTHLPKISPDHKELFHKTLHHELSTIQDLEGSHLFTDYYPCDFLEKVLDLSMMSEYCLPGKTSSYVENGTITVRCGHNGEFKELK